MFGSFSKPNAATAALERIRAWTQDRFALAEDEAILVAELACGLPGCPPVETVVTFWTRDGQRHHYKVFKTAVNVTYEDVPYAWMKRALAVPEGYGCDCC